MKKKIVVIGHYAKGMNFYDGQTVKTRILYDELIAADLYDVELIDTYQWKRNAFSLIKKCWNSCRRSDYILMMPDFNGFRALSVLLPLFRGKSECKLIYVVVGGWISSFLANNRSYLKRINRFDAVVVETNSLKREMEDVGVHNLHIIPNFKRLNIIDEPEVNSAPPYRFCIFSRIMKEKGVEDAIAAVKMLNEKFGENFASLDMYGQIDLGYKETFAEIMTTVPPYVKYNGVVDFDKCVDTLKEYHAMLFPTYFKTEGLPGTVIDAFASALPVLSYQWNSSDDLIDDGVEGWLCETGVDNLFALMERSINEPDAMKQMRLNCLKKAYLYAPDANLIKISEILNSL